MNNGTLASGEVYLKAWNNKDLEEIARYLHPDVHFIGPMTEMAGKEKFLQSQKTGSLAA